MFYPSVIPHAELAAPEMYMKKYRGKYLPEKEYVNKKKHFLALDKNQNFLIIIVLVDTIRKKKVTLHL